MSSSPPSTSQPDEHGTDAALSRSLRRNMGHDLRAPLTAVRAAIELALTEDPIDVATMRDLLRRSEASLDRLQVAIEALLIADGVEQWNSREPVSLASVLRCAAGNDAAVAILDDATVDGNAFLLRRCASAIISYVARRAVAVERVVISLGMCPEKNEAVIVVEGGDVTDPQWDGPGDGRSDGGLELEMARRVVADHGGMLQRAFAGDRTRVDVRLPVRRESSQCFSDSHPLESAHARVAQAGA